MICAVTGLRLGEALSVPASAIDLERAMLWLGARDKGKRGDGIPLGPASLAFFRRLKLRAVLAGVDRAVIYRPHERAEWRGIKSISTAWQRLMAELGFKGRHRVHHTKTT